MKIKRVFFGLTSNFVSYLILGYSTPIFTNLMTKRGFTPVTTSYAVGVTPLFIAISTFLAMYLLKNTLTKRVSIYIGIFLANVGVIIAC